jgi:cobalt-zinc-cadmium efflux system protein
MAHEHCNHHHHEVSYTKAFGIAIALNIAFVAIEFVYGVTAHSMALIADAGHNLSDVLSLLLAGGAALLSRQAASERFTYGLRSSSIIAALINSLLLLLACGAIAWEAIGRFITPAPVEGLTVSVVAAIGIVINGLSAWLFWKGSKSDLNIKAAFLHMLADAFVSLGVVVTGGMIFYTGLNWIDPVSSLIIVGVIVWGTWGLLRDSLKLSLNAVPGNIDIQVVRQYLQSLHGVTDVHDLHIWGMSTKENALTVHLVMPNGHPGNKFLEEVRSALKDRFLIHHCTIQIEVADTAHGCSLA